MGSQPTRREFGLLGLIAGGVALLDACGGSSTGSSASSSFDGLASAAEGRWSGHVRTNKSDELDTGVLWWLMSADTSKATSSQVRKIHQGIAEQPTLKTAKGRLRVLREQWFDDPRSASSPIEISIKHGQLVLETKQNHDLIANRGQSFAYSTHKNSTRLTYRFDRSEGYNDYVSDYDITLDQAGLSAALKSVVVTDEKHRAPHVTMRDRYPAAATVWLSPDKNFILASATMKSVLPYTGIEQDKSLTTIAAGIDCDDLQDTDGDDLTDEQQDELDKCNLQFEAQPAQTRYDMVWLQRRA
jgi:hypothetical protein